MKKGLLLKAISSVVVIVMISAVLSSFLLSPTPLIGAANDWGDKFTNSSGKYICICDATETDCNPCIEIEVE